MAGYQEEEFTIQFAENISQQEHMHQDVELIFVIDGRVMCTGRVPSKDEILHWISR